MAGFLFHHKRCVINPAVGHQVQCDFVITNQGKDRALVIHPRQTRVFAAGSEYQSSFIQIGNESSRRTLSKEIPSGTAVDAVIAFDGVPLPETFPVLEIGIPGYKVRFHDVPILSFKDREKTR